MGRNLDHRFVGAVLKAVRKKKNYNNNTTITKCKTNQKSSRQYKTILEWQNTRLQKSSYMGEHFQKCVGNMRNSIAGNPHLLEIEKLVQRDRYARFVCWLQEIFIIKIYQFL